MGRVSIVVVCGLGWLALLAGIVLPLIGVVIAALAPVTSSQFVYVPSVMGLFGRSVFLSAIAAAGAVLLGLPAAAVLGSSRGRATAVVLGLILAPLLIPPHVYAYAWDILGGPRQSNDFVQTLI